jgi:predicted nucleotidyltransferase
MKNLNQISLTENQKSAIKEFKKRLRESFAIVEMIIYGSTVRGESDDESDLDILIVTRIPLEREVRHQITDIACEINLRFDTNISTLVIDRDSWHSDLYSILPIHKEIINEGVSI